MTEHLTDERLDELRRVAEAATPGPWHWEKSQYDDDPSGFHQDDQPLMSRHDDQWREVLGSSGYDASSTEASSEDRTHIAAFDPPTVLALLDESDRLRKFAQLTQERDWARLNEALRCAANGTWSIECDRVVGEILESHAMTGTWTPDTAIPYGPILLDGIYEAITGIPVSEETLAGCRRYFARFPERRVFAESAAEAKKSAEEARRELRDYGQQEGSE